MPPFQSSVRINVGPNATKSALLLSEVLFQSSVRINVGPNDEDEDEEEEMIAMFQSSVRINVGPNKDVERIYRVGRSFNPP